MAQAYQGSMVAIVTPMHEDGAIAYEQFAELIDWHIAAGTSGIVVLGTTGEAASITQIEREKLLKLAIKRCAGKVPVIAGVGTNNTLTTIELAQHAESMGVDALLLVTPYYNKPPQRGLYAHFEQVHEKTTKPIILYNVPGRTACDMAVETVIDLSKLARIIAVKEATGEVERVAKLKAACGDDFYLLSGDDATAADFVLAGGHGVISVTGNIAPKAMAKLMKSATSGDEKATKMQNDALMPLHQNLFLEANPIPVKWALNRMGKIASGLRLPLVLFADNLYAELESSMHQCGVIE